MFGNKEKRQERKNRRQDRREARRRNKGRGEYGIGNSDIFAKYGGSVGSIGPNGVL